MLRITAAPSGQAGKVLKGEVFDVAVDMRRSSPTFGHWVSVYLSEANWRQLRIPTKFAHGLYITSTDALFT